MLSGRKILLGISGSIAAYKSAHLTRLLIKAGAEVKVVMTASACEFITPLTLSTLSKHPVYSEFVSDKPTGRWTNHVELALWADTMIIAPATANVIAKMANGLCDNLLLAAYLSAKCPVYFAPAMDLDMFKHFSTQSNIEKLQSFGNKLIQPETGELASGLFGEGRMAEPEIIIEQVLTDLGHKQSLKGKKVMISAGPTHESIDAVRFIGNQSSGKMGFALAEKAAEMGADVTLIAGPVDLTTKHERIKRLDVTTSDEMFRECTKAFEKVDIGIMAAAIADFKPKFASKHKLKKEKGVPSLTLIPTKDVLASLGKRKKKKQMLVGFALETSNEKNNARKKLQSKNLDLIVLNSLKDEGAGFGYDTNKVTIINRNNKTIAFELKSKQKVAEDILSHIADLIINE